MRTTFSCAETEDSLNDKIHHTDNSFTWAF